jgi:hypothetical protein
MFKNGINNAIKIASTGSSNSNINSSTYILLDSGSNPTPGTNEGTIKFNIATQAQGAIDRFVITPYSSIFYNNLGIGKSPSYHLDISGNTNSNTIYENNVSLINKYATIFNVTSPLSKDASNNILIDLSAYPLKINVDTSLNHLQNTKEDLINVSTPLIKNGSNITIDLSAYALKNSLNASNVTAGTLPVSFGGIGTTTLNNNQILIGNGTNAIYQSNNLSWDNNTSVLTSGSFNAINSVTAYGGIFTNNNLSVSETAYINKDLHVYQNAFITSDITIGGKMTVFSSVHGSNATSKSLIQFQTKLGANSLYYYNLDVEKYYKTGQNINGKDYKVFNLTSWAEDGFSIINKCTVYTSSEGPGIKYIMFYDNWGGYLPNGNQTGWQRDNSPRYMTFLTTTSKNIITILENLL